MFTVTSICARPSAFSSRSRALIARPTVRQSSSCSKLFSSAVSSDFVNCPPWRHEELTPSVVGSVILWFERRAGLLQKASPALLAEPIAVTADCDHGAVVQQAIQDGGGDHRVAEHRAPLGDRAVRGEQDRAALVTPADQLEEQVGGVRIERQVAELVDDQQLRPERKGTRLNSHH